MSLLLLNKLEPHAVQVKRQKIMYIVLAIIEEKEEATASVPAVVSEDKSSDFEINAKGVLKKYKGAGGNVVIPAGITSIGYKAFFERKDLADVTIGNGVRSIERAAFGYCQGLRNITIGSSVTSIKQWAFTKCKNLKEIHIQSSTPPSVDSSAFYTSPQSSGVDKETCKLYVPLGAKAAYAAAWEWKEFKNIIEEETGVSPVADSSVRAYVSDGGITIKPGRPAEVSVYTVSGQKVYQSPIVGTAEICLNSGVYIVKADNVSQKVVVK